MSRRQRVPETDGAAALRGIVSPAPPFLFVLDYSMVKNFFQ
jgi:hypothetical protein